VIFLDIHMTGLDGPETARRILARAPHGGRPRIIAVTGNATDESCAACLAAGVELVLEKPLGLDALRRILGTIGG
jgi:CheY-like chemotaxis protein